MLNASHLVDTNAHESFLLTTKSKYGGYGKVPGAHPDLMHSYMGIAALAILKKPPLESTFCCCLGVSKRAVQFAKSHGWCLNISI